MIMKSEKSFKSLFCGLLAVINSGVKMAVWKHGNSASSIEVIAGFDQPSAHEVAFGLIHKLNVRAAGSEIRERREHFESIRVQRVF